MGIPIIEKVGIVCIIAIYLQGPLKSQNSHTMKLKPLKNVCSYSLGDGRYSLLGQPLQYNLSICPPLLHGQSTYTMHQVRVSNISLRAIKLPSHLGPYL
jgi:hypothetical protein